MLSAVNINAVPASGGQNASFCNIPRSCRCTCGELLRGHATTLPKPPSFDAPAKERFERGRRSHHPLAICTRLTRRLMAALPEKIPRKALCLPPQSRFLSCFVVDSGGGVTAPPPPNQNECVRFAMTKKDVSRAVGPFKFFKPENHHNRIAIVGSCVLVALPSGHHAIIDACNISLISGYKWHVSINGCGKNKNIYAVSSRPSVSMHRVLMSAPDGLFVDHINSNGLDNRSANMRLATHAQNMANRRKSKNRRSPFKGVTYDPGNDRTKAIWRAHLTSNGRRYKGPRRRCHFKAAMDYDELSRIYHGEFSRRNIK